MKPFSRLSVPFFAAIQRRKRERVAYFEPEAEPQGGILQSQRSWSLLGLFYTAAGAVTLAVAVWGLNYASVSVMAAKVLPAFPTGKLGIWCIDEYKTPYFMAFGQDDPEYLPPMDSGDIDAFARRVRIRGLSQKLAHWESTTRTRVGNTRVVDSRHNDVSGTASGNRGAIAAQVSVRNPLG